MTAFKRSYDDFSGFEVFQFPRNVRARLCARHQLQFTTLPPTSKFRPILRKSAVAGVRPDSKEGCDSSLSRRSRIRFYQKVAVHCIPARHQYPPETKQKIWNTMMEIREMARRNTIEFASEGYDWRKAAEDDAMLLTPDGERVHPVWRQKLEFQPTRKWAGIASISRLSSI
jgi:hypothetical protein